MSKKAYMESAFMYIPESTLLFVNLPSKTNTLLNFNVPKQTHC